MWLIIHELIMLIRWLTEWDRPMQSQIENMYSVNQRVGIDQRVGINSQSDSSVFKVISRI